MKIKFNKQVLKIVDNIQKKVDKQSQEALNRVIEYATNHAQLGFDRFVIEVPSDDPYVWVKHTPIEQIGKRRWSSKIICTGNQVVFIEFGAGVYNYTESEVKLYNKYLGGLDHRGTPHVDDIGNYHLAKWGRSRGADDVWFYKSQTGRESENSHLVKYNSVGEPIMITHGNRPARALYRAVGMSVMRLARGKLR